MLRQRVITAVIGAPFLIAAIWFGDPWFTLFIAAMALVASLEFYKVVSHSNIQPVTYFGAAWALLLVLSPHCPYAATTPLLVTSAIVIPLIWLLFRPSKEQAFNNWAWTIAGILYIGWMLSYWIDLRSLEDGRGWVLWAMLITFASDISAFFIGRAWGKHSLASGISPGKTWEGAIGGFLTGIIASVIFSIAFSLPLNYWQMMLLGGVISIFAQLGDLVESLLKRNAGTKDSGKLLPGHGGILDRFDSTIFTGAVAYYIYHCITIVG